MANRFPLIVDRDDGNRLKELPTGDNLDLTGSGIVNAGNISATGLTLAGVTYNPFSGDYNDLTNKPTIPDNTDNITEGTTNLFYSAERMADDLASILVEGTNVDIVYNDDANTITINATGGGVGGGASSLDDLTDVNIGAPSTGQVLRYQGSTGAFINTSVQYSEVVGTPSLSAVALSGSYTSLTDRPNLVVDINDLSDVDTVSTQPTSGQVLKWNGNNWAPADDITSGGSGLNADTLDGFDSTYYLNYSNLTNKPNLFSGSFNDVTDKPTTLAGYGITDALGTTGDINIDGTLTVGTDSNLKMYNGGSEVVIRSQVQSQNLTIQTTAAGGGILNAIKVDTGQGRIGVFNTNPQYTFDVNGSVKGNTLYGNGSNITGITFDQVLTGNSVAGRTMTTQAILPAADDTYDIGASGTKFANVYASAFYGDGSNLTNLPAASVAFADLTGKPTTIAGYGITDAFDGAYGSLTGTPTIPSALTDLGITDGSVGQVLSTDGNGNFSFVDGGTSIGNFTLSNSVIDTDDSSEIVITPAVRMNSDLVVENDLTANKVIADEIISTNTGVPTITSNSSINLSASDRVIVNRSPLTMASFTSAERDALTATNGDMIYNTTTNKFQGYAGGAWVDLH